MKGLVLCLVVISLIGCSSKTPIDTKRILSVDTVMQNLDELNGKDVKVAGFMPGCGGYDCSLFSTEQQAKDFWVIANDRKRKEKLPKFVEIGWVRGFDEKAAPLAGHYVIVIGRVTNECRSGCLDRGPNLVPASIALAPQQPGAGRQS